MSLPLNPYRITTPSQRVAFTSDILHHILQLLPQTSLFATLLTNRFIYSISATLLYKRLTIKPGHKYRNPFVEVSPFTRNIQREYTKPFLLSLIHRVDMQTHKQQECPNHREYMLPLPNLRVLHLAGGEQKYEYHVDGRRKFEYCGLSTCPFITQVCNHARTVIVRDMDFRCLRNMGELEEVIVKVRPCQVPDLRCPSPHTLDSGQRNLPSSVRVLKLVWWDELHQYRVDWQEREQWARSERCSRGSYRLNSTTKGCVSCTSEPRGGYMYDQRRKGIKAKDLRERLCGVMVELGRRTGVVELRMINFDKTAQMAVVGNRDGWTDERLIGDMEKAFREGRKEKVGDNDDIRITYQSTNDYYPSSFIGAEYDQAEEEYWKNRMNPSQEILQARAEIESLISERFSSWKKDELEYYSEQALRDELEGAIVRKAQDRREGWDRGVRRCGYRGNAGRRIFI